MQHLHPPILVLTVLVSGSRSYSSSVRSPREKTTVTLRYEFQWRAVDVMGTSTHWSSRRFKKKREPDD